MPYSEVFQYIDKIITVPEDLKTLKTPQPYLYNVLKNEAYGENETCDLNIHREISQDIIEKHKKMIFVTNQGKLEGGFQAKLPIVASYIYSHANSSQSRLGALRDKITPT